MLLRKRLSYGANSVASQLKTGAPSILSSARAKTFVAAAALSIVLTVGTGGFADPRNAKQRGTNFDVVRDSGAQHSISSEASVYALTISDCLAEIRSNFELSAVDLSNALGVSRQTVYDWLSERQMPQAQNLARMRQLQGLSIRWRGDIATNISSVRRKFADKAALLQILSSGDLASDSVLEALRSLAFARAAVQNPPSITDLKKKHRFNAATRDRQDEALNDAGR